MAQVQPEGSLVEKSHLLPGTSLSSNWAFNGLGEAHQYYGGRSALPKVHYFNVNLVQKHPPSGHVKLTNMN